MTVQVAAEAGQDRETVRICEIPGTLGRWSPEDALPGWLRAWDRKPG